MPIRIYSFSAAGGHAVNEDAFIANPLRDEPEGALVCVADGQGGRSGGGKAAKLACGSAGLLFYIFHRPWANMLQTVDSSVAARDAEAGFTTLVALSVRGDTVTGASCGDSAAVAVCAGEAPRVLTSHQFKNPPVGSGEATFVPFEMKLTKPWKLLVMSDGVWKYANWDRVWDCAVRLSGEELIAELQAAARLKTTGEFQDDFTIVLLESE